MKIDAFLPKKQDYIDPIRTWNDSELYNFYFIYGIMWILTIFLGFCYSAYCSYPSIRKGLCSLVFGYPSRGTKKMQMQSIHRAMNIHARLKELEMTPLTITPIYHRTNPHESDDEAEQDPIRIKDQI